MLQEYQNRFTAGYESDAAFSYLVLCVGTSEKVVTYPAEMIAQNPIESILPLDVRRADDKIYLYYQITSKISLAQFLKRKKLSKIQFIDILKSINKTFFDGKNYFLSDNGFLLEEEYIYIDPIGLRTSLVYIPIGMEHDFIKVYKTFITNMIICTAQIDDSENDNFLQKILNYLKSETFNIQGFDKLLTELTGFGTQKGMGKAPKSDWIQEPANTANQMPKEENRKNTMPIPPQVCAKPKEEIREITKKVYKKNTLIIVALLQVLLFAVAAVASLAALSSPEGDITPVAGVVLLGGAFDYILLKKLLDKKNLIEVKVSQEVKADIPRESMLRREAHVERVAKPITTPKPVYTAEKELPGRDTENIEASFEPTVCQSTEIFNTPISFDTVILDEGHAGIGTKRWPYLKNMDEADEKKIVVNKESFIIGRLKGQADYISENNAIGKLHAEIITKQGTYFIKDLNSKNGTFINGQKINSNLEYEIKDSDKVKFANSEYLFVID